MGKGNVADVGDQVKKGQTLGYVEQLGTFVEIKVGGFVSMLTNSWLGSSITCVHGFASMGGLAVFGLRGSNRNRPQKFPGHIVVQPLCQLPCSHPLPAAECVLSSDSNSEPG